MDLSIEETTRANQLVSKRLLSELQFEQGDIDRLRQNLLPNGIQAWNYPTLAAMMTVGIGVYYYNRGDFWSEFPNLDSPADRISWGRKFESFITGHDSLETFRSLIKEERSHRYVGPILAHGGIPQTCLPDFFSLITRHGDREQSGRDVIGIINSKRIYDDKPVQRFLKYGGEVAEEFVSRSLALWQCYERSDMAAKCGLPNRVVEEFSAWWPEHRPKKRSDARRMPRPELRIEPDGLGVYLYLPRCDDHPKIGPNFLWQALGEKWSVTRAHEVPLAPNDNWKITGVGNEHTLEGPSDVFPVLFFDPNTGKAISEPSLRRLPANVWVVFKGELEAEPLPVFNEDFSRWSGYRLATFDLADKSQLRFGNNTFDVRRPFFHCDADPIVQGVQDRNGLPVFNALPEIKWSGKANLSLTKDGTLQGNIDIEPEEFSILMDKPGEYDIELRGPFGESLRKHYVLVPGLTLQASPLVMWPKQNLIRWNLWAEAGVIKSGSASPPFTRHDSFLEFKVEYDGYEIDLRAEIPRLSWRLLLQPDSQAGVWSDNPLSVWLNELSQTDYPLFECAFGSLGESADVFLAGKHSASRLFAKQQRTGEKSSWYFDLRVIRDELDATGNSEELDLLIRSRNGAEHFRGKVLSVKPLWHLQEFSAKWKKKENRHIIDVSWRESGRPVIGRWLVVIPLWRSWEGAVLQHHFNDNERNGRTWDMPLSDLKPGRYMVKAVHAPWGCDNWIEAQAASEQLIDVYPESWPEIFGRYQETGTVDSYLQSLLAHWYRPQLVQYTQLPPSGLPCDEIKRFLDCLRLVDKLERVKIPQDGSGSLNIFCANAMATTEAYLAMRNENLELVDIWSRILPSTGVITLELNEKDKGFVREVAFQFSILSSGAVPPNLKKYKRENLSGILGMWRKSIRKLRPPVDEVIFLCEKFHLSGGQGPAWKREYEKLKSEYQSREAI